MSLVAAALIAASGWAQMEITFSGIGNVTQSTLDDGSTYVQFPLGIDLNEIGESMLITIGGQTIAPASITPDPTKTFITDGEIETFIYDGKAYSFRFTVGEYFTARKYMTGFKTVAAMVKAMDEISFTSNEIGRIINPLNKNISYTISYNNKKINFKSNIM